MNFAIWGVLLVIQAAVFTFVSRARNSGSYGLHAIALCLSNGVYMTGQFVGLDILLDALKGNDLVWRAFIVVFYTAFTMIGGLGWHWIAINYVETGKRKVGA